MKNSEWKRKLAFYTFAFLFLNFTGLALVSFIRELVVLGLINVVGGAVCLSMMRWLKKTEENEDGVYRRSTQALHSSPAQDTNSSNAAGTVAVASGWSPGQQAAYAQAIAQSNYSYAQQSPLNYAHAHLNAQMTNMYYNPMYYNPIQAAGQFATGVTISAAGGAGSASYYTPAGSISYTTQIQIEPSYKDIKYDGVRAGEIIAYRCWPIKNGFLWSTAAGRAWAPNEPMTANEGDLEKGIGIFAFKSMSGVIQHDPSGGGFGDGVAFGSIELWGEIIEHDIGYRAQFAAIRSIDFISHRQHMNANLDTIRQIYQVEEGRERAAFITLRDESGPNN